VYSIKEKCGVYVVSNLEDWHGRYHQSGFKAIASLRLNCTHHHSNYKIYRDISRKYIPSNLIVRMSKKQTQSSNLPVDDLEGLADLVSEVNSDHGELVKSQSADSSCVSGGVDNQINEEKARRETRVPGVAKTVKCDNGVKISVTAEDHLEETLTQEEYYYEVVCEMPYRVVCAYCTAKYILELERHPVSTNAAILAIMVRADEYQNFIYRLNRRHKELRGDFEYHFIRGGFTDEVGYYVNDMILQIEKVHAGELTEGMESLNLVETEERQQKARIEKARQVAKQPVEQALNTSSADSSVTSDGDVSSESEIVRKKKNKGKTKVVELKIPLPIKKRKLRDVSPPRLPHPKDVRKQSARKAFMDWSDPPTKTDVAEGYQGRRKRLVKSKTSRTMMSRPTMNIGPRICKKTGKRSKISNVMVMSERQQDERASRGYHSSRSDESGSSYEWVKKKGRKTRRSERKEMARIEKNKKRLEASKAKKHLGWKAALEERKEIAWIKYIPCGVAVSKPIAELDVLIDKEVAKKTNGCVLTKELIYCENGKVMKYTPDVKGSYMFKVYQTTYYGITIRGEKDRYIVFRDSTHKLSDQLWLVGITKSNRYGMELGDEYHAWCKLPKGDEKNSRFKSCMYENYNDTIVVWGRDPNVLSMDLRSLLDGKPSQPGPDIVVWEGQPIFSYTNTEHRGEQKYVPSDIVDVGGGDEVQEEVADGEETGPTPEPNLDPIGGEVAIIDEEELIEELETGNSPATWTDAIVDLASKGVESAFKFGNNGGLNYTGGNSRPSPIQFLDSYLTNSNAFGPGTPEHYVDAVFLDHDYGYWVADLTADSPQDYLQGLASADAKLVDALNDPRARQVPEAVAAKLLFTSLPKARTLLDSAVKVNPRWYGRVMSGNGEVVIPDMGISEFNDIFGFKPAEKGILSEYYKRGEVVNLKPSGGAVVLMIIDGHVKEIDRGTWDMYNLYGQTRTGKLIRDFDSALGYNGTLQSFVGLLGGASTPKDSKIPDENKDFNGIIEEVGKYEVPARFSDYNIHGALNSLRSVECKFLMNNERKISYQKNNYVPGTLAARAIRYESWLSFNSSNADAAQNSIADLIGYVVYKTRITDDSEFNVRVLNRSVCGYYMNIYTTAVNDAAGAPDTVSGIAPIPQDTRWRFVPAGKRLMEGWGREMETNPAANNYLAVVAPGGIVNRVWSENGRQDMQLPGWFGQSLIDNIPRIDAFLKQSTYNGVKKISMFALALNVWMKAFIMHSIQNPGYGGQWTVPHNCNINLWGGIDYVLTPIGNLFPDAQTINEDPDYSGEIMVCDEYDFMKYIIPNYTNWSGWAIIRPRFSNIMNITRPRTTGYIQPVIDESQMQDFHYLVLSHLSHPIRRFTFTEGQNNRAYIPYHNLNTIELAKNILVVLPGARDAGEVCGLTTPQGTDLEWCDDTDFDGPATNPGLLAEWDYTDAATHWDYESYLEWAARYFGYLITPEEWSAAYTWIATSIFGTFQPRWAHSVNLAPWVEINAPYGPTIPRWTDGCRMDGRKVTVVPQYDVRVAWMWTSQMMVPVFNTTTETIIAHSVINREYLYLDMQRLATLVTNAFDLGANINGSGVGVNIDNSTALLKRLADKFRNRWFNRGSTYGDVEIASLYACKAIGAKGIESMYHFTRTVFDDVWNSASHDVFANLTGNSSWNADSLMFSRVDPMELGCAFDMQAITGKFGYDRFAGIEKRNFAPRWTIQGANWTQDIRLAGLTNVNNYGLWGYKQWTRAKWDPWMYALHSTFCQVAPDQRFGVTITTTNGLHVYRTMNFRTNIVRYDDANSSLFPYKSTFLDYMLLMPVDKNLNRWGMPVAFTILDVRCVTGEGLGWMDGKHPSIENVLGQETTTLSDPLRSTLPTTAWDTPQVVIEGGEEEQDTNNTKLDPTDKGDQMKEGNASSGIATDGGAQTN
jgi:hypothetical protein